MYCLTLKIVYAQLCQWFFINSFTLYALLVQLGNFIWRPGLHPDGTQQGQPVWHQSVWLLPHHVAVEGTALKIFCVNIFLNIFYIHADLNIFLFCFWNYSLCTFWWETKMSFNTTINHLWPCLVRLSLFVSDSVCVWIYNKETDVPLAEAQSHWNMPSLGRYISLSISLMSAFQ